MAIGVSYQGYVVVNGVDLSDHAKSITLTNSQESKDITTHGSGARIFRAGLSVPSAEANFFGDNASGSVTSTLRALVTITSSGFPIVMRKVNSASTTVNPTYTLTGIIDGDVALLAEEVGEPQMLTVKFSSYSGLVVSTSAT